MQKTLLDKYCDKVPSYLLLANGCLHVTDKIGLLQL